MAAQERNLLGAWAPPKSPDDMTEEELDEWAGAIYDALSARAPHEADDEPKPGDKPDTPTGG